MPVVNDVQLALRNVCHRVAGSISSAEHQRQSLDGVFGGWEMSVVTLIQTGQFLTPAWTGPDPTGTAFTSSTTPATVTIRPNILRDPNLDGDQRTLNRWFDASAFAPRAGEQD